MSKHIQNDFMSLFDYVGHKDLDGTGEKLYTFAMKINSPMKTKIVPWSPHKGGKIRMYPKTTIDMYFKK